MSTDVPDRTDEAAPEEAPAPAAPAKRPLYPRLLRLRNIAPNGWQRAALGEGALALAVVLVLADVASAWTLLALPLGVAGVVKGHDLLAGVLRTTSPAAPAVDPEEREPDSGLKHKDLAVLDALRTAGADLSRPRQVLYTCYAPDEPVARALANVAAGRGFTVDVRPPAPDDGAVPLAAAGGRWAVVCETTAVVAPDLVREHGDFFEDLADRYDAEYDGWEAEV
jgi:hypothetical protein